MYLGNRVTKKHIGLGRVGGIFRLLSSRPPRIMNRNLICNGHQSLQLSIIRRRMNEPMDLTAVSHRSKKEEPHLVLPALSCQYAESMAPKYPIPGRNSPVP